jgi:hypothetical protein
MRNGTGMSYQEKQVAMCEHLQNASSRMQKMWRLGSAYRDEMDAIMHLADYEVDQRKLAKMIFEITLAEDSLREAIENTSDKLLRQPKSARARRMWLRD